MNNNDLENLIWESKHRPQTISETILPEKTKSKLQDIIKSKQIPNLLFSGVSGTGKTTTAKAIANELGSELLFINASLEGNIDTIRTTITDYVTTMSFNDSKKIVLLDECLSEDEYVRVGTVDDWKPIQLKYLQRDTEYPIVSFNYETKSFENDIGYIISDKEDELYEVELESGKMVVVNGKHPFVCEFSTYEHGEYFYEQCVDDGIIGHSVVVSYDIGYAAIDVVNVRKIGTGRVINLSVKKNHTFVTGNGIVTHNCDHLTDKAQPALRGFLDQFSGNAIFIFTCNYKTRIIPALISRLEVIDFSFSKEEKQSAATLMLKRSCSILDQENIKYEKKAVAGLVAKNFPDFRKTLVELQSYSTSGEIDSGVVCAATQSNMGSLIECIKKKDFSGCRKWVSTHSVSRSEFYRELYDTMLPDLVPQTVPQAILDINRYQTYAVSDIDQEINQIACLIEIMNNVKFK